jgi:hypothetical protein
MNHPVVARRRADRHGGSRNPGAREDGPQMAREQTGAALRLMHCGDAAGSKPIDDGLRGALDGLDNNSVHPASPALGRRRLPGMLARGNLGIGGSH